MVTSAPAGAWPSESRKIPRDLHEDARDVARRLMGTPAFIKSRDERKRVEMRFAHLKTHHGNPFHWYRCERRGDGMNAWIKAGHDEKERLAVCALRVGAEGARRVGAERDHLAREEMQLLHSERHRPLVGMAFDVGIEP